MATSENSISIMDPSSLTTKTPIFTTTNNDNSFSETVSSDKREETNSNSFPIWAIIVVSIVGVFVLLLASIAAIVLLKNRNSPNEPPAVRKTPQGYMAPPAPETIYKHQDENGGYSIPSPPVEF